MGLEDKLKADAEKVIQLKRTAEIYKECLEQLRSNHLFGIQFDDGKLITNDMRFYGVLSPDDVGQIETFVEKLLLKKIDYVYNGMAALETKYRN